MSTLNKEELQRLINKGDLDALCAFFSDTSYSEREPLYALALKCYRKASKLEQNKDSAQFCLHYALGEEVLEASIFALICTASSQAIAEHSWSEIGERFFPIDHLLKLRPEGLTTLAESLITSNPEHFKLVRRLIKENICPKPQSAAYILALISTPESLNSPLNPHPSLAENLLDNPDILEEDIWRFFEIEGDQERNLVAADGYYLKRIHQCQAFMARVSENLMSHQKLKESCLNAQNFLWSKALISLANDGKISRQRLLEASLKALARGFIAFRSGWFSRLHEELKPSLEERREFVEAYGKLLGSPISQTVSFAVKAWLIINKKYHIPVEFLTLYLSPALTSNTKATVLSALTLLENAIRREETFSLQACLMAIEALQQPAPEIQEKVLILLEKYSTAWLPDHSAKLKDYLDYLAPSARERAKRLLHAEPTAGIQSALENVTTSCPTASYMWAETTKSTELQFLPRTKEPIASPDELVEAGAYCLEHTEDALELERFLDGISRLGLLNNHETLTKPLLKRASKLFDEKEKVSPLVYLLAWFLQTWLKGPGEKLDLDHNQLCPLLKLEKARMDSILSNCQNHRLGPLLSYPTHWGGWIDAFELITRLKQLSGSSLSEAELCFTILRLPPEQRTEVASQAAIEPRLQTALEFLISDSEAITVATQFSGEDSLLSRFSHYTKLSVLEQSGLRQGQDAVFSTGYFDSLRLQSIAFPVLRETFYNEGISMAVSCINGYDVSKISLRAYLEPLTLSGQFLGKKALALLSVGLFVAIPECAGLAIDALIIAIQEKRLDIKTLAFELSRMIHSGHGKTKRLSQNLAEIARLSMLHSDAVRQILEYSLSGEHDYPAGDISSLLELLRELLITSNCTLHNEATRQYLMACKTGGKTGKMIKVLLQ